MDIHKPKPVHSWREFLSEIGVVVCGILIAITLEQAVEGWRRHEEVAEARASLHDEIALNDTYFSDRLAVAECEDRDIEKAAEVLNQAERTGRTPHVEGLGPRLGSIIIVSEWEAEKAGQVIPHFPRWERARLAAYYTQVMDFMTWRSIEGEAWDELRTLNGPPRPLSSSQIDQFRIKLERIRTFADQWRHMVPYVLKDAHALGVKPLAGSPAWRQQVCAQARVS